jgi:uncharacterized metal-binding protein YceD (DUF177 family)
MAAKWIHEVSPFGTKMKQNQPIPVEFSRLVEVEQLGADESVYDIEASEAERAALARRFGLLGIDELSAQVALRRVHGGVAIRVRGSISTQVTQTCVVTLASVQSRLRESFALLLVAGEESPDDVEVGLEEELEEPLPPGPLDIGEMVAQHLALALPQYPRAPGAKVDRRWSREGDNRDTPFAALAKLKMTERSGGA